MCYYSDILAVMPKNIISLIPFCASLGWLARAALGVLAIICFNICHVSQVVISILIMCPLMLCPTITGTG